MLPIHQQRARESRAAKVLSQGCRPGRRRGGAYVRVLLVEMLGSVQGRCVERVGLWRAGDVVAPAVGLSQAHTGRAIGKMERRRVGVDMSGASTRVLLERSGACGRRTWRGMSRRVSGEGEVVGDLTARCASQDFIIVSTRS